MAGERDIDAWVEALVGRGDLEAEDRGLAALREALREASPAATDDNAATATAAGAADEPRLDALLNRLRGEGLLPEAVRPAPRRTPFAAVRERDRRFVRRRPRLLWAGAAALAAGLVLAVLFLPFAGDPDLPPLVAQQSDNFAAAPRLRSPVGPPVTEVDTARIARVLRHARSAGLPHRLRQTDRGWRLDLYVPDETRAAASEWLSAESIPLPDPIRSGGWLRLETVRP